MDNPTLLVALSVLSCICSVALIANWASNRLIPGLLPIAAGYVISTLGILLLTTQDSLSPLFSTALASILIMGGRVPLLYGLAAFWNQERSRIPWVLLIAFVLASAGFLYFTLLSENLQSRSGIFVLYMVVFFFMGAFILLRGLHIERRMRPNVMISTTYGAYFLIGLFIFNALTDITVVLTRSAVPLTVTDPSTFYLLLNHFVTMIVIGFAVIMMTMEELSIEHKENAIFDPITSALNHRTFIEVAQRALGIALRYSAPVSLITLEILNYDQVKALYKSATANSFLRHVTSRTAEQRRNEDVLGRCSTTEFRLLLPGVDEAGTAIVVQRIEEALRRGNFHHLDREVKVEFAISAVTKREEGLNLQQMLQDGEIAMFKLQN